MFLVALTSLATSIEQEATALAADVGQTAYEVRLLLADDPPCIVLRTPDRERAVALLATLRGRGHGVVACEAARVAAFSDMTEIDGISADGDGLRSGDDVLAWSDVVAIVRFTVRKTWQTTRKETKREMAVGMAIATGGVILSKKVTKEHTERHEGREQFVCVFRRGGPAWIASENGVDYGSLPGGIGRTATENFERFVEVLRTRSTAPYDDRFLRSNRPANDRAVVRLLEERVHVLALSLARGQA